VTENGDLARAVFSEAVNALGRQKTVRYPKRKTRAELEAERDRQKRDLEAWKEETGSLP
jgi:hypothetical protein